MYTQLKSTARLAAAASLTTLVLALQACGGGGGSDPVPEPVKPTTYDLQAAMTQYYTKANTWNLSGIVTGAGLPAAGTAVTMVLTTTPMTGVGTHPVLGKQFSHMSQSMTLNFLGTSKSAVYESFFDPATAQAEGQASLADDSCEASVTKGSYSRTAKVGDTGSGGSGIEYISCQAGSGAEANFVDTWVVKQDGARVLLCLERSAKVVATGFTRTGSQCLQLNADSSLGSYVSFSEKLEDATFELKTP
ncbi:hypothetical protein LNV09_00610 [Paucibacter sp. B2R-40]|uniref:hypothetical protein n=1 Tax=Paucibacter sp. B2R-40 TaxID=2893554 RepID=UPI0021E36E9E|nr:hypothetical protein [Paucibacter sp. B2R-40]MCV2352653.1 hypothetical protein [Paucibacter sp. B2R-40]